MKFRNNLSILFSRVLVLLTFGTCSGWAAGPANDHFQNAHLLLGYATNLTASTAGASMQGGELRWAENLGGHSIWYNWTAPASGTCFLDGTGPGSGLLFNVFVGNTFGALGNVTTSAYTRRDVPLEFHAIAGTTYRISVDGFQGEQGDITFSLRLGPPNDNILNARPVFGDNCNVTATTFGATLEASEPTTGNHSVWWTWTAPETGTTTIQCFATNLLTAVSVYSGTTIESLSLITSGTADVDHTAKATFNAVKNATYALAISDLGEGGPMRWALNMNLVRLVAPLNGQVIPAADIVLVASLPAESGAIERIDFFNGAELIGTRSEAPYQITWNNTGPGTYLLSVQSVFQNNTTNTSVPVTVSVYAGDLPTPKLAAGYETSYAISPLGELYLWGWIGRGQYGLATEIKYVTNRFGPFEEVKPTTGDVFQPPLPGKTPASATQWKKLAGGNAGSFALAANGVLYGNGVTPVPFPAGVTRWSDFEWSTSGIMLLTADGAAYIKSFTATPVRIPFPEGVQRWTSISSRFLMADTGVTYECDVVSEGQTPPLTLLPPPPGGGTWREIQAVTHTLALTSDGRLFSRGFNYSGQLGTGDYASRDDFQMVPFPEGVTKWTAFALGGHHSLAKSANGRLYAWGRNWENQLGTGYTSGTTVATPTPVIFPAGVTAWTTMAAGFEHSVAIGNDGAVYAWGWNEYGQLGVPLAPPAPVPLRVIRLTSMQGIPVLNSSGQASMQGDGKFRVTFKTEPNQTYYVQYSSDTATWTTVYPSIIGNGENMSWLDEMPAPTTGSRFYRVIVGNY